MNTITEIERESHGELVKWMSKKQWNFYSTVTFRNKLSDETINRKMGFFSNHYLIDSLLWFREYTSDGNPHIHMVIKSNKIIKGYRKLKGELREWGNTDFHLFSDRDSTNCISYISKEFNKQNNLWGIK